LASAGPVTFVTAAEALTTSGLLINWSRIGWFFGAT
jgi:hypothetical protein